MKVILQPEFLCSYYYHAAKNASEQIADQKLPDSLYHGLISLMLWQCVFESYANFQIRRHKLESFPITRKNGKRTTLEAASIKEKWINLPIARTKQHFTLNKEPFTNFEQLVDLRNDLIHFNKEALAFEKDAPAWVVTNGDLKKWMATGDYLSGSIFDSAVRFGIAGKLIVRDMFNEYSRLTEEPLPAFLNGHEAILAVRTELR